MKGFLVLLFGCIKDRKTLRIPKIALNDRRKLYIKRPIHQLVD